VTGEVPLMQQPKTGRKFSVAIDKFVDELQPAGKKAEEAPSSAPSPHPPPSAALIATASPSPAATALPAAASSPRRHNNNGKGPVPTVSDGSYSLDASLDTAASAVAAKLRAYTLQLGTASHPNEEQAVLSLIGECARTIAALKLASSPGGSAGGC
jgi:hypothetical protein